MKYFFLFSVFLLVLACNNNKSVYWCGDHACINKKEKEAYFKKTMIVEVKNIKNLPYKDKSEISKIIEQAKINEKNRKTKEKNLKKNELLKEKLKIDSDKALAKQMKFDEKQRIKNEKKLLREAKIKEKKRIKKEKKLLSKKNKTLVKNKQKNLVLNEMYAGTDEFNEIVKKIKQNNTLRDYPDINNVPK
jgi:hypothetical protein